MHFSIRAQPRDVEDRSIIDVAPGMFDTVTKRRFCEKFYAMVTGRRYNVPALILYCAINDNDRDEVLEVLFAPRIRKDSCMIVSVDPLRIIRCELCKICILK